jgi:hypothetical protein
MTNEEREQVVELLRCAADSKCRGWKQASQPRKETAAALGSPDRVSSLAFYALEDVDGGIASADYQRDMLEAAQRVEEGTWP